MHSLNDPLKESTIAAAKEFVEVSIDRALDDLKGLVEIPGIAWEAFDAAELEKSASTIKRLLENEGIFDSVHILTAQYGSGRVGAPAVVARRTAKPGKPTVLLYAHHDVQPPGDRSLWLSDPFKPEVRDGRLFGRGAADDKAGVMTHIAAIRGLKDIAGADLQLGIVLFIEGEEEAGSPSFGNFLRENQNLLAADVIVVADSGNWSESVPALTTTLRGVVALEFEVKTLDHAVHSGMFGGAAPDAMLAMVKILNSLWDEKGQVSISGLKTAKIPELDYEEALFRKDSGVLSSTSLIGEGNLLSRIWSKPALTVIGLDYPSVALSSNTLLPSIKAKLSLRIAPGEDPEAALEALKAHLKTNNVLGAEIAFGDFELGKPFELESSGWAKNLADFALETAYGVQPVDIGVGGSIPFIADFEEVFPDAQILVTGVEDPDSRAHSPNESLHLDTFHKAILAELLFLLATNQINT